MQATHAEVSARIVFTMEAMILCVADCPTDLMRDFSMQRKDARSSGRYGWAPQPGAPHGLDPANAQIYYTVHPRASEQAGYLAEHARWAQRETLKALKLASEDAAEATEAASRTNEATLRALRSTAAQAASRTFPEMMERQLPGQPWRVLVGPKLGRGKMLSARPPESAADLENLLTWFKRHPGPPGMADEPAIRMDHGHADSVYRDWRKGAALGERKSAIEAKASEPPAQEAAESNEESVDPSEKESAQPAERFTPEPEAPLKPPVPFLLAPAGLLPWDPGPCGAALLVLASQRLGNAPRRQMPSPWLRLVSRDFL
eukprot:TRINITY_DN30852_c0_g1_i2.p1 TRINITY_DN30852_c0_g1~~TRINITY_DN30852_c0_g1_i2.p1  ORF type:complete len:335 (-),score=60.37 TRINITY_DN30852_c0_g1_i2:65-1015(-)